MFFIIMSLIKTLYSYMLVLLSKLEVYLGTINYTTFNILYNLYICKELAMPEKKASKKLTISIQIA